MNQPAFGDELRRLRLQRGLSLKKFAQLVHYDPGYLSKIENGLKPPTGTVAGRCGAALEADGTLSALAPAPALSEVDGFVLAPSSEAVIANWVRTDGRWYVDKTKSKPVIQAFGDVIGHARAHGLSDAANPATRLAALADYLNIDWTWLTSRCCALAEHSCRDFARPRSRLLSIDGVDTACRYVASLHHEPTSASG
ncbi:MAG: helix-turn-helix domain-containing protein [Pseudonocardiaceae bacterium]